MYWEGTGHIIIRYHYVIWYGRTDTYFQRPGSVDAPFEIQSMYPHNKNQAHWFWNVSFYSFASSTISFILTNKIILSASLFLNFGFLLQL